MKVSPHYTELKFLLTSTYETLLSQSPWWFEDCDANTHCSVSEGWLEISLPSRVCLNYLQLKIRGAGKRSPAMGMVGVGTSSRNVDFIDELFHDYLGFTPCFQIIMNQEQRPRLKCPELLDHNPALRNRSSDRVLGCAPGSKVKWEVLVTFGNTNCI